MKPISFLLPSLHCVCRIDAAGERLECRSPACPKVPTILAKLPFVYVNSDSKSTLPVLKAKERGAGGMKMAVSLSKSLGRDIKRHNASRPLCEPVHSDQDAVRSRCIKYL